MNCGEAWHGSTLPSGPLLRSVDQAAARSQHSSHLLRTEAGTSKGLPNSCSWKSTHCFKFLPESTLPAPQTFKIPVSALDGTSSPFQKSSSGCSSSGCTVGYIQTELAISIQFSRTINMLEA